MTHEQVKIIKRSWRLLRDVDPHLLGDVFYKRLFLTHPSVRSMFKGTMTDQYEKFVHMLNFIVARIDRPNDVMSEMANMAKRHEGYGVKPTHYAPVGEALLWTLEQGLGKAWNDDIKQAWLACYEALTQAMLEKV